MKVPAFQLLKEFVRRRELRLSEVAQMLEKHFGDHRDWYPVAGLIRQGYLANPFRGESGDRMPEKEIASALFALSLGEGRHRVNNVVMFGSDDPSEEETLNALSKADLYFAELRQRRVDRLISAAVAVVIGVSSALLTLYVRIWLGSPQ